MFSISLLTACGQSSDFIASDNDLQAPYPELLSFSFLTLNNPELTNDIILSLMMKIFFRGNSAKYLSKKFDRNLKFWDWEVKVSGFTTSFRQN